MQQKLKTQVALQPGGEGFDVLGHWGCLCLPKTDKGLQLQPYAAGTSQVGLGGAGDWLHCGMAGAGAGGPRGLAAAPCLDVLSTDPAQHPLLALAELGSQPLRFEGFSCKTQ